MTGVQTCALPIFADLTVRDKDGNMPPLDDLLRQLKGELKLDAAEIREMIDEGRA